MLRSPVPLFLQGEPIDDPEQPWFRRKLNLLRGIANTVRTIFSTPPIYVDQQTNGTHIMLNIDELRALLPVIDFAYAVNIYNRDGSEWTSFTVDDEYPLFCKAKICNPLGGESVEANAGSVKWIMLNRQGDGTQDNLPELAPVGIFVPKSTEGGTIFPFTFVGPYAQDVTVFYLDDNSEKVYVKLDGQVLVGYGAKVDFSRAWDAEAVQD